MSGDGSIKIWDLSSPDNPYRSLNEHSKEVYSVDWNLTGKDTYVTGSWDNSIKVWAVGEDTSIETFDEHT